MGEDPYLSGVLGAAIVKGMQRHVVATLKHLAAYGIPQGGHNAATADVGPNRLMSDYLPSFEKAIREGGAKTVMTAYNTIDGVPCTANAWLLQDVLRNTWGFDGVVFADLNAINALYATHHVAADPAEAAALALKAGVDIDLGGYNYGGFLKEALHRGLVTEADIDRSVRRVLQLKYDLGLFENPYVDETLAETGVGTCKSAQLAKQVSLESAVLLKNDGILPFSDAIKKVAVIGPNADNMYNQLGDYTAPQDPDRIVTMLEGVQAKGGVEVVQDLRIADVVVLVVGGSSARDFKTSYEETGAAIVDEQESQMDCGEGYDRSSLTLLWDQETLMRQVYALGKPVVTVYICGRPMDTNLAEAQSNALLLLWYPGMEGGSALADILWGDYNPSGRLPISIPRSVGQIPVYYSQPATGDYVEESARPLYPFGYGLSYSQFEYADLEVDGFEVSFTVTNIGPFDGDEVVQLYLRDEVSRIAPDSKLLKKFERIHLKKGESSRVVFRLEEDELESGDYTVMVGGSSNTALSLLFHY